jgi:hypothetical protein
LQVRFRRLDLTPLATCLDNETLRLKRIGYRERWITGVQVEIKDYRSFG